MAARNFLSRLIVCSDIYFQEFSKIVDQYLEEGGRGGGGIGCDFLHQVLAIDPNL